MENSYKALFMAAAAILFAVGCSVAIYSYTSLLEATDSILTTSENYSRTSESFTEQQFDNSTRQISGAEIICSVLNMRNSNDYTFKKITVEGKEFEPNDIDESLLKDFVNTDIMYQIESQNYGAREITYKKID